VKVIFCLTFVYSGILIEKTTLIDFIKVLMSLKGILKTCLDGEHPTNQMFAIKNEESSSREYLVAGNPVRKNIPQTQDPGVYMIYCTKDNMRYYGETSALSGRIASHKYNLKNNIHPCDNLQKAWNLLGEEYFDFVILEAGYEWADSDKRLQRETELIIADKKLVYNVITSNSRPGELNPFYGKKHTQESRDAIGNAMRGVPKTALGKKISINGKTYDSLSEAERVLGIVRKTIRARLADPNNANYFQLGSDKDPGANKT